MPNFCGYQLFKCVDSILLVRPNKTSADLGPSYTERFSTTSSDVVKQTKPFNH